MIEFLKLLFTDLEFFEQYQEGFWAFIIAISIIICFFAISAIIFF